MNDPSQIPPPGWPFKFLRHFLRKSYLEEIEGDMEERFQDNLKVYKIRKAKRLYIWDSFKLLRLALMKKMGGDYRLNHYVMFRHYLKIAVRNFYRSKMTTFINVSGLSLGICCAFLISIWVLDEYSHDRFHEKGDRLYQVLRNQSFDGGPVNTAFGTAYPIGDALVGNIPEIVSRVRFATQGTLALEIGGKLAEASFRAADAEFFRMFSFPLKEGLAATCLADKENIVISRRLAEAHFPGRSAIGEMVAVLVGDIKMDFTVSGVMEDFPQNSSFNFDAIILIDNFLPFNTHYKSWGNSWLTTYVLLNEHARLEEVNNKIEFLPKQAADVDWFTLLLHPYENSYLYSNFQNGKVAGGRIDYVILFSLIAVFTLLIACFNFINLTTAHATKRSKEIGIKKVMGAGRTSLLFQFTLESFLMITAALFTAICLAYLTLPVLNEVAGKDLKIDWQGPYVYLVLTGLGIITLVFSGIYPSIFLSSFHAVSAVKGKLGKKIGTLQIARVLMVIQFSLSMVLIAGAVIVFQQLTYIHGKSLGIDKENVIYTPLDIQAFPHKEAIKNQLLSHSSVQQVSAASGNFINWLGSSSDPAWEGKPADAGQLWFSIMDVDYGLLEMMDIEMVSGRRFSKDFATDTLNYIINDRAARIMGIEDPVGKSMHFWGEKGGKIVGIVKDFHFVSLHSPIDPMIIRCRPSSSDLLYIKTSPGKTKEALLHMAEVHDQFSVLPFNYHFLDEVIENGYEAEQRIQKIAGGFSVLTIFISCMGLLGLVAFSAQQRLKEISIRKVFGAKWANLVFVLTKEYFILIAIGVTIGIPIVHYWGAQWLQNFNYRITIDLWIYSIPVGIILFVAWVTIGKVSFRVVTTNPADSLRNE